MHAATIENCPRCLARDRATAPLTFKAFRSPSPTEVEVPEPGERTQTQDRVVSL